MRQKERDELKLKALNDYLAGKSKYSISKDLKIRKATIVKWAQEGQWDKKKEEIVSKGERKAYWNREKEMIKMMNIIRKAEDKYSKELEESVELPKTTTMMAQLLKIKLDILMPKQINNFTKNENLSIDVNLSKILEAIRNGDGT